MKITIREARRYFSAFEELARIDSLPSKLHFKIAILLRNIRPLIESSEDTRRMLVVKYGVENLDGGFAVPDRNIKEFATEWDQILDQVIDISDQDITMTDIEKWVSNCDKIKPLHTEALIALIST